MRHDPVVVSVIRPNQRNRTFGPVLEMTLLHRGEPSMYVANPCRLLIGDCGKKLMSGKQEGGKYLRPRTVVTSRTRRTGGRAPLPRRSLCVDGLDQSPRSSGGVTDLYVGPHSDHETSSWHDEQSACCGVVPEDLCSVG